MDVTPLIPVGRQIIQAYGNGGFRITGVPHNGSVLITPNQTLTWPVQDVIEMSQDNLAPLFGAGAEIQVLLIGCGRRAGLIPPALRVWAKAQGAVIDAMDTGAACRTYNVLLSEDRHVAAALIAVE